MMEGAGSVIREGLRRWGYLALLAGAVSWLALLVTAPVVVGRYASDHLAVRAATAVYLAGAVVCHQRSDRSFRTDGVRLPVCGRCLGLYAGAAVGLLVAGACSRRRAAWLVERFDDGRRWRVLLGAAAVPAALSWLLEAGGALPPALATPIRAGTGLVLGAVGAWAIGLAWRAWSLTGR